LPTQQVSDQRETPDAPLSGAPQGGGANMTTLVKLAILQQQQVDIK
jgi:hypothetical protein